MEDLEYLVPKGYTKLEEEIDQILSGEGVIPTKILVQALTKLVEDSVKGFPEWLDKRLNYDVSMRDGYIEQVKADIDRYLVENLTKLTDSKVGGDSNA
jgi:hypothetical protein